MLAFPKPKAAKQRNRTANRRRAYRERAREWLIGRPCAIYPHLAATQVHHAKGRRGALLMDERYWVAVSAPGHQWVHAHPLEARELGLTRSRNACDS